MFTLGTGYSKFPPSLAELDSLQLKVRVAVASIDGNPVGCLSSLIYERYAAMWEGGLFPEFRATNANAALYWDSMRWVCREGATTYDLVGIPDAGIGEFKRQFGGDLSSYVVASRCGLAWRTLQYAEAIKSVRVNKWFAGRVG
jgi:lipid II:glycine glycyltransferase (peptidoglycan interpeptide bridge formation enzyme)